MDRETAFLYRTMQLIRTAEEQLARCYARQLIHGACHTYVGQEAIASGVCLHLRPDDAVFSTHRGHGHALAKGLPVDQLFAELFGRATGCSRGRGGSMHLFAPEIGLMGTSGIVGPCILQAAGAGYSFRLSKSDRVAAAFFGDGAVNNGAFHEGLNLAAIWKLPVLFVCENNQFATEVPFRYAAANPDVASRAQSYGMPGIQVDGNDARAVGAAARHAVERARSGEGPTLIECLTYRTRPHSEGMGDYTYRTREEVSEWRRRCPIQFLRAQFPGLEAEFDSIDREITDLVAAASKSAEEAPWPGAEDAATHVFASSRAAVQEPGPEAGATRELSLGAATLEALDGEMSANPAIFVLGEGIGVRGGNFGTTAGLFAKYGAERLRDTPIAERGFTGLACGAAMAGARPIVDFMFIDFLSDAFGEIVNQIAKMQYMSSGRLKMPVLLRGCIGIGHSAATHHSGSYYSIYSHIPGLRVVVPSSPYDAKGLFTHALRCQDPVLFLEPRELMAVKGPVPVESYEIPFGKARVVKHGSQLTAVAVGAMVPKALSAAGQLENEGLSVELIDPRTITPLDLDTILASVEKTGRLLIVEETFAQCNLGAEIAAQVASAGFDFLDAPIRRLTGAAAPTPYSPPLEAAVIPSLDAILDSMRRLIRE
ncbi:MAG: dehydrogenase [Acidobacteria bacterium]|nr:dehydrogenase [Acidobacteriota bacterium]